MGKKNCSPENQCRLCAAKDSRLLYMISGHAVVNCTRCGFVQVLDMPDRSETYVFYSEKYFQRGKYVKDKAIEKVCQRRINWLRQNGVRNQAKVLDIGCATGDFIESAKTHFEMWGVDISEYAVNLARRQNPEIAGHISCSMVEDVNFSDESFDAIVLWDVLEHLWDPLNTIPGLIRFLKPGGILAISTPNIGSMAARILGRYWPLMTVPEHLGFFNRHTLQMLIDKSNLDTQAWVSQGTWGNVGFLLNKIGRIIPGLSFLGAANNKMAFLSRCVIYVPTMDIQYLAARKKFP